MNAQTMPLFFCWFPGSLCGGLRRACATCGWSRWTRHSGGPEYPRARTNGRSLKSSDRAFDMSAGFPAADSLNQHLSPLEINPESQLGCCANEALQKGPVLRIRSEDEY